MTYVLLLETHLWSMTESEVMGIWVDDSLPPLEDNNEADFVVV